MAASMLDGEILTNNGDFVGIVAAINLYLKNLESESEEDDFIKDMILRKCAKQIRQKRNISRRSAKPRLGLVPRVSTQNLSQVPVPRFSAGEFKRHLGMSKTTFEGLSLELGPLLRRRPQGMSLEKQLTIGLWLFANNESFGSVCDRFAVSVDTCWTVLKWTMDALHRLDERRGCIEWPRGPRVHAVVEHFRRRHGFPGVVGCLGARRVLLLKAPSSTTTSDKDSNSNSDSLVLQAVCDDRASFVDVHVTRVDTTASKASVFQHSPLARRLARDQDFLVNGNGHLLAESSYPLLKHLLTPYEVDRPTEAQRCYDAAHARCRASIDRAFARLLCRFRGLAPVDVPRPHLAPDFVSACCVLHNYCIARGDRPSKEETAAEARVGDGVGAGDECSRVLRSRPLIKEEQRPQQAPRGLETIKRDSIANVLLVVSGQNATSI